MAAAFQELGAGDSPISHTLLLRDRCFVGHRYRCGDWCAIWKPSSTVIEFFGADGELLRTITLEADKVPEAA
jgi:hypothetical protein